jgi:FdhD protein
MKGNGVKGGSEKHAFTRYRNGRYRATRGEIVREVPLHLFLNGEKIITIACTGIHLKELAVGYLRAEGLVAEKKDLRAMRLTRGKTLSVHVSAVALGQSAPSVLAIASSGARGRRGLEGAPSPALLRTDIRLTPEMILNLMDQLLSAATIHEATRGTHCSGLADPSGMIVNREDIGRHNTIDMLGGYALLEEIDCSDKILLTTGRISSEIVLKAKRMDIPVIISHSAPTSRAIALCREMGMILIGYVRGGSFNTYVEKKSRV